MSEQQSEEKRVDPKDSYFRGYVGMEAIRTAVFRLAEWMKANRPSCRQITLKGKDYDYVRRWPRAASMHGFTVTETGALFDGFELRRAVGPKRYEK